MHTTQLNAKVIFDNTANTSQMPVIVIKEKGVLVSHVKYLNYNKDSKSISWMKKSAQAVRLLIEYSEANAGCFENPQKMFEGFISALHVGTCDEKGYDPSGLYWRPKKTYNANVLVKHITYFSEWLHNETAGKSELLNKIREAAGSEKIMLQAAFQHKYRNAFLNHTMSKAKRKASTRMTHHYGNHRPPPSRRETVKFFPEELMTDLLSIGFALRKPKPKGEIYERVNLRNVLITLLMHYGGLRMSECFHIYVNDIKKADDGTPIVDVYHPVDGISPDGTQNRATYLNQKFGLQPRNISTKANYHAGWKGSPVDKKNGNSMRVYFFPMEIENLFYHLWKMYAIHQRVFDAKKFNHPFAFTDNKGEPYGMKQYVKAHNNAVRRIGYVPAKNRGTTPHGHRHAAGQRLAEANVDEKFIMRILHHGSLDSQRLYKEPPISKIRRMLEETKQAQINTNTLLSKQR